MPIRNLRISTSSMDKKSAPEGESRARNADTQSMQQQKHDASTVSEQGKARGGGWQESAQWEGRSHGQESKSFSGEGTSQRSIEGKGKAE